MSKQLDERLKALAALTEEIAEGMEDAAAGRVTKYPPGYWQAKAAEDDETEYVYVKIDREAVELMADPTYIVPILDHDPISVVIYACRAALEGER